MTTPTRLQVTYDHILIPTDFTDISNRAMEYAKCIAKQANSQLFLVHVNPPVNLINPPEEARIDPSVILRRLEEQLEQSGEELRSQGFHIGTLSMCGSLQDEIISVVQRERIDLIVLGTHSRRGFERLMFGSDAESVLRHVSCPVITIGPLVPKPSEPVWHPKNVLCATTLHPDSARAAAYAYVLALQFAAQFSLLTVNAEEGGTDPAGWEAFAHAFQRHLPADMGPQPHVQTLLSDRRPGTEIAAYASNHAADLIVMGAHSAPALATHLAHGTASRVFAEAQCPVMTLRVA